MSKLYAGTIGSITAIDDSTTYPSWSNFVNTLDTIIQSESEGILTRQICYINPDILINPADHPDHIVTGIAVQQIMKIRPCPQVIFAGYHLATLVKKLSLSHIFWKAGMLAVYEKTVFDKCGYSTLKENPDLYIRWRENDPVYIEIKPEPGP